MHSQNQRFLKIQMKQKKEADAFKSREEAKFKSDWDYTAPAESLEHILRVNDFQKNLLVAESPSVMKSSFLKQSLRESFLDDPQPVLTMEKSAVMTSKLAATYEYSFTPCTYINGKFL